MSNLAMRIAAISSNTGLNILGTDKGACTKCRLESAHRGGPHVAPSGCLASTDIFQCLFVGSYIPHSFMLTIMLTKMCMNII